jgi:hypothetical protein
LLPGYARRFSLKRTAQVDPTASVVFSYPQPFDAVTFYRQDDIRAFGPDHRARLMTELQDAGAALLFVKTHHLNEVLADLPANLEFQTVIDDAGVTAGRVVPRRPALWAGYAKAQ